MGVAMCDLFRFRPVVSAAVATLLTVTPSAAQAPAAFTQLQTGIWELRDVRRSESLPSHICVRDPAQFFQIRHTGRTCSRRILNQDSRSATARYECPGAGWGQTVVTVETPRLVRVDTQGIEGGAPFHQMYEARRTGACS